MRTSWRLSVREGAVAMVGPLIDTSIVCSITGLVIVTTNSRDELEGRNRALVRALIGLAVAG